MMHGLEQHPSDPVVRQTEDGAVIYKHEATILANSQRVESALMTSDLAQVIENRLTREVVQYADDHERVLDSAIRVTWHCEVSVETSARHTPDRDRG